MFRGLFCIVIGVSLGAFVGCGGGGKPIPTSGVVTLEGEPLADARVTFTPTGTGKMSFGQTDSLGRFSLTTVDGKHGAYAGQYKITVHMTGPSQEADRKVATDLKFMMKERDRLSKVKLKEVHPNYLSVDKTPLQQEIPADGEVKVPLNKTGS
jgi:hypothetical protein